MPPLFDLLHTSHALSSNSTDTTIVRFTISKTINSNQSM